MPPSKGLGFRVEIDHVCHVVFVVGTQQQANDFDSLDSLKRNQEPV